MSRVPTGGTNRPQVASHSWNQVGNTWPIEGDAKQPLEDWVSGIELVAERPLIVLLCNLLRRQNSFLCNQKLSVGVKRDRGKHDVLCAICKLLLAALSEYAEGKAYDACQQTLRVVSAVVKVARDCNVPKRWQRSDWYLSTCLIGRGSNFQACILCQQMRSSAYQRQHLLTNRHMLLDAENC